MLTNRSAPHAHVVPILMVANVRPAVAWCARVFGFVEQDSIELVIAAPTATTPPPPTFTPTTGPTTPPPVTTVAPPATTQPAPGTTPAAWGINTLLRVKPSKIFAWLRAAPSSFGVPADYSPGGDQLYVMSATPQSDGLQWWWRVRYRTPAGAAVDLANELRLPVGEPVEVRLASADVIHSFWIPSLAGKMDMIPGRVTRLVLEPTRAGVFHGACAEYCGIAHALMSFRVVVEERDRFARWLAISAAWLLRC